jgi:hypothetical protein
VNIGLKFGKFEDRFTVLNLYFPLIWNCHNPEYVFFFWQLQLYSTDIYAHRLKTWRQKKPWQVKTRHCWH